MKHFKWVISFLRRFLAELNSYRFSSRQVTPSLLFRYTLIKWTKRECGGEKNTHALRVPNHLVFASFKVPKPEGSEI